MTGKTNVPNSSPIKLVSECDVKDFGRTVPHMVTSREQRSGFKANSITKKRVRFAEIIEEQKYFEKQEVIGLCKISSRAPSRPILKKSLVPASSIPRQRGKASPFLLRFLPNEQGTLCVGYLKLILNDLSQKKFELVKRQVLQYLSKGPETLEAAARIITDFASRQEANAETYAQVCGLIVEKLDNLHSEEFRMSLVRSCQDLMRTLVTSESSCGGLNGLCDGQQSHILDEKNPGEPVKRKPSKLEALCKFMGHLFIQDLLSLRQTVQEIMCPGMLIAKLNKVRFFSFFF